MRQRHFFCIVCIHCVACSGHVLAPDFLSEANWSAEMYLVLAYGLNKPWYKAFPLAFTSLPWHAIHGLHWAQVQPLGLNRRKLSMADVRWAGLGLRPRTQG